MHASKCACVKKRVLKQNEEHKKKKISKINKKKFYYQIINQKRMVVQYNITYLHASSWK